MRQLTKEHIAERNELLSEIEQKAQLLKDAIEQFDAKATESFNEIVMPALEQYNAAVVSAQEFAQGIADDANAYYDEKSEKWQESSNGESYKEFLDEWAECANDLEEIEIEVPSPMDLPDLNAQEVLEKPSEKPE